MTAIRKKRSPKPSANEVTLAFDLLGLPTAQHKAGLAGLILQIRAMQDRKLPDKEIPELVEMTPTGATVRFTELSAQGLFDELYDSRVAEVAVRTKWSDEKPKREIEVEEADPGTGKTKKTKRFIYDVVQPCGHFLHRHFSDGDALWLKLWRDMLWAIPRGKPTTRQPFKDRAGRKPCGEGKAIWRELVGIVAARGKNEFRMCEVASALLLGAQATNAELVPFRGRSDETLLLHFWPLTTLIYVPQSIDREGNAEFSGFTLAIPEVADLEAFCEEYPRMLADLDPSPRGYRPAAAVIDIPAQAGLEFLEHLARLTQRAVEKKRIHPAVSSIEYMHLVKSGNNTKAMAAGRVVPRPGLLDRYLRIVGDRSPVYRNPVFRASLLTSLLDDVPWFRPLAKPLVELPWPWFVRGAKTPRGLPWFHVDSARYFQQLIQDQREINEMSQAPQASAVGAPRSLEILVYKLIQNYVNRKTEDRSKIAWDSLKKVKDESGRERTDVPEEYREAREKVASDAFLAMRSRREQDFVDYFTATICSVRQFLSPDEYCTVAVALRENPDDVKTLALLALSANS